MNAVQMPLALNLTAVFGTPVPTTAIELLLGLTEWKRSGDDPPEHVGWYRSFEGEGHPPSRRFYNGRLWSAMVTRYMSDEVVEVKQQFFLSPELSDSVIWCGLRRPHLVGYFDPLTVSDRTQRLRLSKE